MGEPSLTNWRSGRLITGAEAGEIEISSETRESPSPAEITTEDSEEAGSTKPRKESERLPERTERVVGSRTS